MMILYIDPGTGSMLISAFIALVSVGFFMLKGFIFKAFGVSGDKGEVHDREKKYGLVFYSEGKQYWNVFYPLLEECSERGIQATYMTSSKDDPAFQANIEGIEVIYIGTGRESFYFMQRLHADMVVLTTPGLDVIELKRSKNVKHYSHLTHAMGSVAGYKSYAVDYFESVLLGGDLDIKIIRELESLRNLPPKHIEVAGHTYVDALRNTLSEVNYGYTYFEDKRPTILLSPTWGNHGLLMHYGDEILSALDNDDKYNVIIRPHPQSFISEKDMIKELMDKYPNDSNRVWDREIENLKALSHADIMISDFSSITFDFYALFRKPILTMNAHYEKRGRDIIDIKEEPWDVKALDVIGRTIFDYDIPHILNIIEETLENFNPDSKESQEIMKKIDKYPNESKKRSIDFIEKTYNSLKEVIPSEKYEFKESDDFNEATLVLNNNHNSTVFKKLFSYTSLFQYTVSLALLISYTYLSRAKLPLGFTQEFLVKLSPLLVRAFLCISVGFLIFIYLFNKGQFLYKKQMEKVNLIDFFFVLIPMIPITQYIIANQDILNFKSSVYVVLYFGIISLILTSLLPVLLSPILSKSISSSITISYLFVILNMASFGRTTRPLYIGLTLIILTVVLFILMFFKKKSIIVLMSIVFLVTNITTGLFNKEKNIDKIDQESLLEIITSDIAPVRFPNIYVLVYDSYVNEETMKYYGYDNTKQYQFLLDSGFAIYDGTYSVGASSIISMAHFFNFEEIDTTDNMRKNLAYDANTFKKLLKIGYETQFLGGSDYMIRGHSPGHTFSFPSDQFAIDPHKIIISAIKEGEFRFDADFSSITYEDYLYAKETKLTEKSRKPKIFHSHDDFPGHSQNSGVLRPNETEIHIKRLKQANIEMVKDINSIKNNDPHAIIVVAGDHGPYLTKNGIGLHDYDINEISKIDIQDRYGTFLAISWPDDSYIEKFDISTIQEVMPAIFSYIYDNDEIFDAVRMPREILSTDVIGGVNLIDGKLYGGKFDGDYLFEVRSVRYRK